MTITDAAEARRILDRSKRRGGLLEAGEVSRLLVLLPRLLDALEGRDAPPARSAPVRRRAARVLRDQLRLEL